MVGIAKLMKQAQKMQQEVARIQEKLAQYEIESTAGGGAIKIMVTGDKKLKKIELEEDLLSSENKEMLEDLLVAGVNQALEEAEKVAAEEMAKVTQGMGIPGMM